MERAPAAERHVVQLSSLNATQLRAQRRAIRASDPVEPRLTPRNAALENLADEGRSLVVSLRASLFVRISEEEAWDAQVVLRGRFTSNIELSPHDADYFARSSGLYVLWPFARAYLDQLARLAGIPAAPLLPLIVRPRRTAIHAPER